MGEILDKFLTVRKQNESTISKTLFKELSDVESEIIKRKEKITEAESIIDSNSINIKSIADATGISRKTFYNNELLKAFVLENTTVDLTSRDVINKLKGKINDQESKINKMLGRDADIIGYLEQIDRLQTELDFAYRKIQNLEVAYETQVKINEKNKDNDKSSSVLS